MTSVFYVSCRCVSCTQCGATTPGLRCEWQNNYTQCAPCASLATCPICLVDYSEGTTILQCRQCDRCALFLQTLPAQDHWSRLIYLFLYFLNNLLLSKPSLLSIDGSMHRVRVSIQRKMWKKLQTVASTAQCVALSRPLKVGERCLLFTFFFFFLFMCLL